jgi:peptidoglycan/LPS O-acetylase OafA/YrhL
LAATFRLPLACHGKERQLPPPANSGYFSFSFTRVSVLMMSLARLEKSQGGLAARFYIRRAFRIYPLAIAAVLTVAALEIPKTPLVAFQLPSASELWSNLLLIQNLTGARSLLAPLWSLPYEVQMYLALPFLYLFGKRIRSPLALILLGVVFSYVEHKLAAWFGWRPLATYAPWFFMGIAAFFRRPVRQLPAWLYAPCLIFVVIAELLLNEFRTSRWASWTALALAATFCMLLPMFREIEAPAAKKIFHSIAKYSYGIYLAHMPILWFVFAVMAGQPAALRIIACVAMLAAAPVLLYHAIEDPFIRLGATLGRGRSLKRELVFPASSANTTTDTQTISAVSK